MAATAAGRRDRLARAASRLLAVLPLAAAAPPSAAAEDIGLRLSLLTRDPDSRS